MDPTDLERFGRHVGELRGMEWFARSGADLWREADKIVEAMWDAADRTATGRFWCHILEDARTADGTFRFFIPHPATDICEKCIPVQRQILPLRPDGVAACPHRS